MLDIPIRYRTTAPVMVIGHARSGTSLLVRLLRSGFRIGFGTESQFLVRYYRQLSRYGDLNLPENRERLIRDLMTERWFVRCEKYAYTPDLQRIAAAVQEPTYAGVLNAVFGDLASHLRASRWGDKTPEYLHHLPLLDQLFPQAQYIHVVRDGRDVAESVLKCHFGAENIVTAARQWQAALHTAERFFQTLPAKRRLVLRYEDLLSDPGETARQLLTFLGAEDAQRLVEPITEIFCRELRPAHAQKWRSAWSVTRQQRFERFAGDDLAKYGYETLVGRSSRTHRATEHTFANRCEAWCWSVDHALRKALRFDSFCDSAYRTSLRWKPTGRTPTSPATTR